MQQVQQPSYRCAKEVGFLPHQVEIRFAALGYKVGVGQRVQEGDEFEFDGIPGAWMEPLNEAALAKCQEMVALRKRRTVDATMVASTEPIQVPRSGMAGSFAGLQAMPAVQPRDTLTDAKATPAPRRRAAGKAA